MKIKPKEFNINHGKSCGCFFCECKKQIGLDYYIKKNRARLKFMKHRKDILNEVNNDNSK